MFGIIFLIMAPKNTKSKSTPKAEAKAAPPPAPRFRRQGIALFPPDYAAIAILEARWFPERSDFYRPAISDVMRKALRVAVESGI